MDSKKLADEITAVISAKKGEEILLLDVKNKTILADYFIIATGKSTAQVRAICDAVEQKLTKMGLEPKNRDGVQEGRWAALDYGDVIVHIFNDESRLFYHLERLWGDAESTVKID